MTDTGQILEEMNDRSREVFRRVVESYLATGDPVGSRTLTPIHERKGLGGNDSQCDARPGISRPS